MHYAWVFLGGGIGAALRFALASVVQAKTGTSLPWGTFAVNALGCLAIGVLATWTEERDWGGESLRLFLLVGVLGGFTTFSTFGLETWRLLELGAWGGAALNAAGSVVVCVAAVVAGVAIGRAA